MSPERGTEDFLREYFGVDAEVVWKTVRQELPPLCEAIARMLKEQEVDRGQTGQAHS